MIRVLWFLQLFICIQFNCFAVKISRTDREILSAFWSYANQYHLSELTVNSRIPFIARFFLDTPYQSNTLNVTKEDLPVINLHELDCVTFVENVLALALLEKYDEEMQTVFVDNIVKLRYRNGEIIDYTSRLHYSLDWLFEMQKLQFLTDITQFAGGIPYHPEVCFMSKHADRYPPLKDKKLLVGIKKIETEINQRTYYYIPKAEVNKSCNKIKDGDIILITTNIKGLDTSHLGFALKQEGQIYLLHASSQGKKVMMTKVPLQEYMQDIASQSGIMVARAMRALPSQ